MMRLHQMISGYYITQAIYVAAKLGIADQLSTGPRNAQSLAVKLEVDEDSLYRLLRALTSVGVFWLDRKGCFRLTPLGDLLRGSATPSLRPWAIYNGEAFHWRPWGELFHCVRSGSTGMERVYGTKFFDLLNGDESSAKVFDDAMASLSEVLNGVLVRAYDFGRFRTLVDIGGGAGRLMGAILRRNPRLRGVIYDLPSVTQAAREHITLQGVFARCDVRAGNFFEEVPTGADAYLLKQVLHDWNDEQALCILKNCRAAMPRHAKLLLLEMMIPSGNTRSMGKLVDLEMMVCTGGRERTRREYENLLRRAGLTLRKVHSGIAPLDVIEAVPESKR